MPTVVIRRCVESDWSDVRRLHIKLALGFPVVVDVELNEVLATPEAFWSNFVRSCARDSDQALFLADEDENPVGMGYVRLDVTLGRLDMLYVDGSRRRRGIGSALVRGLGNWAHASGATGLICHIPDESNGGTLAAALGWQRTEEIFYTTRGLRERKWTQSVRPERR